MTDPTEIDRLIEGLASRPLLRRAALLCGRGLRRQCPVCGSGGLFDGWIHMRRRCPDCDLILERGEVDYFIGAYTLNLVIAELMVMGALLVAVLVTWPQVPWTGLLWALVVLTIPAVYGTYPFAHTLWLALDLFFRPPERGDFAPEAEVVPFPPERRHPT